MLSVIFVLLESEKSISLTPDATSVFLPRFPKNARRLQLKRCGIEAKDAQRGLANASRIVARSRNQVGSFGIGRRPARAHVGLINSIVDTVRCARMHTRNQAQLPTFFQPIAMKRQLQDQIAGPIVAQVKIARTIVDVTFCVGEVPRLETGRLPIRANGVVSRVVGTVVQAFGLGICGTKL